MDKPKIKKTILIISIVFNIGMLFVFKYLTYTLSVIKDTFSMNFSIPEIALPIGISFFTFQAMSYVIDAYKKPELVRRNILDICLYISFFPQLIAGPIVKFEDISLQIYNRKITLDKTIEGLRRFICGLGKKILIANAAGQIADIAFSVETQNLNIISAWAGALCYVLQIFFDFSGYSDMAIGLGKIFGFDFKENFNYPLSANGMTDFWRRWNISVSTWFKEYVYIPLGGNRKGKARMVINKMIVFLLTGIWHGANFTFLFWGIIHGTFLLLESYSIIPKQLFNKKVLSPLAHIYTLLVVTLAFVFFRADNLSQGCTYIAQMFCGFNFSYESGFSTILSMFSSYTIIMLITGIILSTPIVHKVRYLMDSSGRIRAYNTLACIGTLLLLIICIITLSNASYNPFIYFRF